MWRYAYQPIKNKVIFADYALEYSSNLSVSEQKHSKNLSYSFEVVKGRYAHHLDMERLIGRFAYLVLERQICLLLC